MENVNELDSTENPNLQQLAFLQQTALNSAILFNRIAHGETVEEYTDEKLLDMVELQNIRITREECNEWEEAFGYDLVEEFDAVADVFYTATYLRYMLGEVAKRDLIEKLNVESVGLTIQKVQTVIDNIKKDADGSYDTLGKVVQLVIENNNAKFTTDHEEFKTWSFDPEFCPDQEVIDGVTYYFIKDSFGKIRKHDNFEKVDLTPVIEQFKQEI